jgi:hypothetical protein
MIVYYIYELELLYALCVRRIESGLVGSNANREE